MKPPYIPDPAVEHIEPEFLEKDVKNANCPSPPGSIGSAENDILDFDFN